MSSEARPNWRSVPLRDCGRWLSGGTPSKRVPEYWGGSIPWVGPKDMYTRYVDDAEEYVTELGVNNGTRLADRGTILIVVRSMGLVNGLQMGLARRPVAFNQDIKAIQPADGVLPEFLLHALWGHHDQIHRLIDEASHGTKRLRTELLGAFEIRLPPIAEQKRVVGVIGAIDAKLESNDQAAMRLGDALRALFRHQFPATGGPDLLADYVCVVRGRSYKSAELQESSTALVTLKSIRAGGGYQPRGLKAYTGDFKPEQLVGPGELVVAHTDLTQGAEVIGRPALVPRSRSYAQLVASLDLAIVRPTSDRVSIPYLYFLLSSRSFQDHAYAYSNGSTVLHLSKRAIPEFRLKIPEIEAVQAFDALATPALSLQDRLVEENGTLRAIRDELIPRLVTGRLRAPQAETILGAADRAGPEGAAA
jgi:type I restriction enzyme S subunit